MSELPPFDKKAVFKQAIETIAQQAKVSMQAAEEAFAQKCVEISVASPELAPDDVKAQAAGWVCGTKNTEPLYKQHRENPRPVLRKMFNIKAEVMIPYFMDRKKFPEGFAEHFTTGYMMAYQEAEMDICGPREPEQTKPEPATPSTLSRIISMLSYHG